MACYHPIPAFQGGSEPPRLWPPKGTENTELPCGKCLGCRADRATQWAARCEHEASQFQNNAFVTLTYDEKNLPAENHLVPAHLTDFLKRLRSHAHRHRSDFNRDERRNIRYFACGEYGEANQRPHYHAILFNCGFRDPTRVTSTLYQSDTLSALWGHGLARYGPATPAAANYIAQYSLKKQGAGDFDADGVWRPAPFLRMSLRPAIGADWLDTYHEELRHGTLVGKDGHERPIPRYYLKRLKDRGIHLVNLNGDRATFSSITDEILYNNWLKRKATPPENRSEKRRQATELIHQQRKQALENRKL